MSRVVMLALSFILTHAGGASAADGFDPVFATPPRLSLLNGPVSFWRPGAPNWSVAALNTPMAAGDAIATSGQANVEVQLGPQAWLRAANATRFSIASLTPDGVAISIAAGVASVDARDLARGQAIDVLTPHATLAIRVPGYYRLSIDAQTTSVIVRQDGYVQVSSADTFAATVYSGELAVFRGAPSAMPQRFAAPAADPWDGWNMSRGDQLRDSISARHVAPEVYGLAELDRNGTWRFADGFGPVWIPAALPAGWAPYSTGHWIQDPVYGQTWVDDAGWGYAPFHYGRWIDLAGTWAWAPGPRVTRPAYAPALVGWLRDPRAGALTEFGWVALSWGEPVMPWWGPSTFAGRPHWGGWGGPRVINQRVVGRAPVGGTATVQYANAGVSDAFVAGSPRRFAHDGPEPGRPFAGPFAGQSPNRLALGSARTDPSATRMPPAVALVAPAAPPAATIVAAANPSQSQGQRPRGAAEERTRGRDGSRPEALPRAPTAATAPPAPQAVRSLPPVAPAPATMPAAATIAQAPQASMHHARPNEATERAASAPRVPPAVVAAQTAAPGRANPPSAAAEPARPRADAGAKGRPAVVPPRQ